MQNMFCVIWKTTTQILILSCNFLKIIIINIETALISGVFSGVTIYVVNALQLEGLSTKKPRTTKYSPKSVLVSEILLKLIYTYRIHIDVMYYTHKSVNYVI